MLMALVACLSFLFVAGRWAVLSVPLTLAVLSSWFIPQRYSTSPKQQRILFSVIGLPFLFLGIYNFTVGGVVGFQRIAVLGAVYVLAGGVVELYRQPDQARPAVFHAGIVTVMLVGGLTRANPYYIYCLFLYALGLVALLHRPVSGMIGGPKDKETRAPRAILVAGFILALPLAQYYFTLVPRASRALYDSYASSLMGDKAPATLFGFASDLSTIQELRGSEEITARVFGPPTLLRGQVFFRYDSGQWAGIKARDKRELLESKVGRFQLGEAEDTTSWRIEPVKILSGPLAVPAGAVEVVASLEELEVDPFDGLVADNEKPYQVLATGHPGKGFSEKRPLPGTKRWEEYYLQLPDHLRQPLRERALKIVNGPSPGAREAALAIQRYLTENGRYDPGAYHSRRYPILHFLGEGKLAGHCEYFASSLTLLLRSLDIPARYVVGYNASEKNPWGDYLIVRDRDAHAWVEVYVNGVWEVYDPTPAAELEQNHPEGFKTPTFEAIWDYLKYLSSGFWRWVSDLESRNGDGRFFTGLVFVVVLGTVVAFYRFRHSLRFWGREESRSDPLLSLGQAFFARLSRLGLERRPPETPLEFAARVEHRCGAEPAQWLKEYVKLRFRGSSEKEMNALAETLENLNLKRL